MVPPSKPTSDRRASARVPHRVRAVLSTRNGEVGAEILDISVGGLGVELRGELRTCDFVRVLLPLVPGDDSAEWVDPDALVAQIHGKTDSGSNRVGLSFFQLPPATRRRIAQCVAQRLAESPPTAPVPTTHAEPKRPTPAATVPPPAASKAITRELPKASLRTQSPTPTPERAPKATPKPKAPPTPKAPPLHIPRTSARELRDLFHEALISIEDDPGGKKRQS